jgi:hypothetical protein
LTKKTNQVPFDFEKKGEANLHVNICN